MLPFSLGYGIVSIYSVSQRGIYGISAPDGYNFGLVDKVASVGILETVPGQTVLFKGADIKAKIVYPVWQYSLISEGSILATQY